MNLVSTAQAKTAKPSQLLIFESLLNLDGGAIWQVQCILWCSHIKSQMIVAEFIQQ